MVELDKEDANILDRLLDIIAHDGLVAREKLEPEARLDEIGVTADDLVLIGQGIEREFDRDMLNDDELEKVETVRELVALIGRRISGEAG